MNQGYYQKNDLTTDELELIALEHIDNMFIEIRAACHVVNDQYHPIKFVKRHPYIATGIIISAVIKLVKYLSMKPNDKNDDNKSTQGFFDSLLSGVISNTASVLTELVKSWLIKKRKTN